MELKPIILEELNPRLNVKLVQSWNDLDMLVPFFEKNKVFGLDTETTVTDRFTTRELRTIQVGSRDEQFVLDMLYLPREKTAKFMRPYLETDEWTKVGHSLSFEYVILKHILGLRSYGFYDTQEVEKVLYAGLDNLKQKGRWGLKDLVARYFGMEMKKDEQQGFDMVTPLTESQIVYGALDIRFPLAIRQRQLKRVEAEGLTRTVQIEMAAIPAFGDMHMNGMLCNPDQWLAKVRRDEGRMRQVLEALDSKFIPVVGEKLDPNLMLEENIEIDSHHQAEITTHLATRNLMEEAWRQETDKEQRASYRQLFSEAKAKIKEQEKVWKADLRAVESNVKKAIKENKDYEGQARINYGAPKQLTAALTQLGYKLKSSGDEVLALIAENPKLDPQTAFSEENPLDLKSVCVIDLIRLYRKVEKAINQYGHTWITSKDEGGLVDPLTGRIHSKFNQIGADTGRTSSSGPNMQNLPADKVVRSCFVARPGHVIITIDMAGAELCIMAEMSGDPIWVSAFNNGWDVHSIGAQLIFPKEWEECTEEGCAFAAGKQKCNCKGHKKIRNKIKAINFGLAYGKTEYGFAADLGISVDEARELIDNYKRKFPVVFKFLEDLGRSVKLTCEARTLAGRRRSWKRPDFAEIQKELQDKSTLAGLPAPSNYDVKKEMGKRIAAMEREGKNSPIQGGNGDFIKLAMGAEQGYLWHLLESEYGARLLSMVHDELVIEAKEENAPEVFAVVRKAITKAAAEFMKKVVMETEGHVELCWTK